MLKSIHHAVFAFMAKTAVCSLVLGVALPFSMTADAQESTNKLVRVITKREGENTRFFVENLEATEITATFELKLTNLKPNAGSYTGTYPPNRITEAFLLGPVDPDKQWSYSYVNHFTVGSINATHDDSVVYCLPYQPGTECKVTQGYNGSYSHSGADQFAIDWKMPCGTPVHAARAGVVVKVRVDSNVGGPDRKFENCANYILIRHSDGTVANYAHLSKDGSRVKPGQVVDAGDLIGYSGNTGFTSGPHLHFSVFKTKSGKQRVSIPVKFQTGNLASTSLAEGKSYKCVLPTRAVAKAPTPIRTMSATIVPGVKAPAAPTTGTKPGVAKS